MKTFLGKEVSEDVRAVVYLCELHEDSIEILREVMFTDYFTALNFYANTPNPASQIISGRAPDELRSELIIRHACMRDKEWCKYQHEFI